MKKLFLLFAATSMMLTSIQQVLSKNISVESEEEIILLPTENMVEETPGRGQFDIPINAFIASSNIDIYFLHNIGIVTVKITNTTTGQVSIGYYSSDLKYLSLPVLYGDGSYSIEFYISDSTSYIGYFQI